MGKPSKEENLGRMILRIFDRQKVIPGGSLTIDQLLAGFIRQSPEASSKATTEDFNNGMRWALNNGFIENMKKRGPFRLTDAGFDIANEPGLRCRKCDSKDGFDVVKDAQTYTDVREQGIAGVQRYPVNRIVTLRCQKCLHSYDVAVPL
jgi:hypothetical protein